jgi:hypothetical protein
MTNEQKEIRKNYSNNPITKIISTATIGAGIGLLVMELYRKKEITIHDFYDPTEEYGDTNTLKPETLYLPIAKDGKPAFTEDLIE